MTDEELEEFMDWLDARARERQERQRRMADAERKAQEATR